MPTRGEDGLAYRARAYLGDIGEPVTSERNPRVEEWGAGESVDADGKIHRLGTRNYIQISPELAAGFTICSPRKKVLFTFYDEYGDAIEGRMITGQEAESTITPPNNASFMRVIVEYGDRDIDRDEVLITPIQSVLSEKSINDFESFLGGK